MTALQKAIYYSLLFSLFVTPFLAPIRPDLGWVLVTPEVLKTAWSALTLLGISLIWFASSDPKKPLLDSSNLYRPIVLFLLWCVTSLLWVQDYYLAAVMLLQYGVLSLSFLLFFNIFNTLDKIKTLISVLIISMLLVAIIGLLQAFLPSEHAFQTLFGQSVKPAATFANRNMASHFMVMTLPIALIGLYLTKSRLWSLVYGAIFTVGLWYLINTLARQAYVAIIVELLFFALFIGWDFVKNKDKSLIIGLANIKYKTLIVLSSLIFLLLVSFLPVEGNTSGNNKFDRLQQISLEQGYTRFPAWINTLEMIKDHPIAGVGIGQWQSNYPQYYDVKAKDVIFNEQTRLRRLHNEYLEVLANVGLVGYLLLLWLFILSIKKIYALLCHTDSQVRLITLGVSMSLLGFLVVAFFSFPIRVFLPALLVMLWLGIIERLYSFSIDGQHSTKAYFNKQTFRSKWTILLCCTVLYGILSVQIIKWVQGESHYRYAKLLLDADFPELALNASDKALHYNQWATHYYFIAGNSAFLSNKPELSVAFLKKSIDLSPYNTQALLNLALIYNHLGQQAMEKKVLNFIVSFDPKNVSALAGLVKILYLEKNFNDATVVYQRLKNSYQYFKDRNNFGPYEDIVAQVSVSVGDYKYAQKIYRYLVEKHPNAENLSKLATVEYYYLNMKESAINKFKKALNLDSEFESADKIRALIRQQEIQ